MQPRKDTHLITMNCHRLIIFFQRNNTSSSSSSSSSSNSGSCSSSSHLFTYPLIEEDNTNVLQRRNSCKDLMNTILSPCRQGTSLPVSAVYVVTVGGQVCTEGAFLTASATITCSPLSARTSLLDERSRDNMHDGAGSCVAVDDEGDGDYGSLHPDTEFVRVSELRVCEVKIIIAEGFIALSVSGEGILICFVRKGAEAALMCSFSF